MYLWCSGVAWVSTKATHHPQKTALHFHGVCSRQLVNSVWPLRCDYGWHRDDLKIQVQAISRSTLLPTLRCCLLKVLCVTARSSSWFEIHGGSSLPASRHFETLTDCGGSGGQRGGGPTTWTWDRSTLCARTSWGLCPPPRPDRPGSRDATFCSGELQTRLYDSVSRVSLWWCAWWLRAKTSHGRTTAC